MTAKTTHYHEFKVYGPVLDDQGELWFVYERSTRGLMLHACESFDRAMDWIDAEKEHQLRLEQQEVNDE